jgi:transcriptional regulator with XRE-family HTH domain
MGLDCPFIACGGLYAPWVSGVKILAYHFRYGNIFLLKKIMKSATLRAADTQNTSRLAGALRRLRLASGMTLRELGLRSGIATSTLSKIENGHLSPTYEKIVALANALDADVAELFATGVHAIANGRRGVCRNGEGVLHSTPQYDYELLCADINHKQFVPLVALIKARSIKEFPSLLQHQGEEFLYVLDGVVTLHTEFYQPLTLNEGDSCYFDSTMGHACVAAGGADARILWICSKNTPRLPIAAN